MEEKENKTSIRDADIVLGIVLFIFFGWTAWKSILMSKERIDKGMATVYTAPGLMPFIISILLLFCLVYIIVYSLKNGGHIRIKEYPKIIKNSLLQEKTRSVLLVFFLLFVYVFILIGRVPFIPATIIYVLAFLFLFKAGKPIVLILTGVLFSVAVVYFFNLTVRTIFPGGLFY